MKKVVFIFWLMFFFTVAVGYAVSSEQNVKANEAQKKEEQQQYANLSKDHLQGKWKCARYVLDNGMEQEFMAKRMPEITFNKTQVKYMMQDYDYEIKGKKIILMHEGRPADVTPFVYDGKDLVQVGDNAKVYYKKK